MEDQYAKKTFLRSGTGWERRMSTLQSSKSYVPKGGFLYTYTAPLTRPSRLKTPSVSKTSTFNTPKSPPCTSQSNDDENIEVTCPHATRSQNNNKTALESSLQQELDCLKAERASLASLQRRLHVTLTEARQQRHREKQKWEEEMKTFHAAQVQELQRLKKCHKALELQLVAQTNIEYHPREEKKMSDQLREELKVAQETIKSQASRHRATVERLQQRIKGLEESNSELKERLISLEEDRIKAHWGDQVVDDRGNEPQKGGAVHIQQPGHQMTKKEQQFREHFERWRIGEDIVVTKFPNGDVEQQYRSSGIFINAHCVVVAFTSFFNKHYYLLLSPKQVWSSTIFPR